MLAAAGAALAVPALAQRTAGGTFMSSDAGAALGALYAAAWTSHDPHAVAAYFAPGGSISVNGGAPSVGRAAIAAMAQGFYDAFPDLVVRMDDFRRAGTSALFVWTLEGHHATTKNFVRAGGWEEWTLDAAGLVERSLGHFDAVDYQRQIDGR